MSNQADSISYNAEQPNRGDQLLRDLREQVTSQARGMWRYRWRVVVLMWLVSIFGWFYAYSLPPVYEANAKIFVDTQNALRPLLQGIAVSSNVMDEVNIVTREMRSRPILAEVARETDLDLRASTDSEFEALLASLQKRVGVSGNRDNIFSISFQDPDRSKAIAVVDSLVNTFVEKSLGGDRTDASNAQEFLRQQIADYEARLTAAEDKLAKFKRDNVAMMPNQGGDYFARLQAARSALDATQSRLRLAQERSAELQRQLDGEEPVFGLMPSIQQESGGNGVAASKIAQLEAQLEDLRLQFTDKHPRIGQILDTIELLKAQQAEEEAASGPKPTGLAAMNPLDINPVYQNMRIQLTNAEVEVASLRAEVRLQQRQVDEFRTLVDTVPQVEAELGRLNRDYDVVQAKYDQLLAQLEKANIGENIGESIDDVEFRIIEPTFAERNPVGPKRQLLIIGALFGALGLGGAVAFLLNQLHPAFFSSREVTTVTGLPILGGVSFLMSPQEMKQKKRGRLQFVAAVGMLMVSATFVWMFADRLSPQLRSLLNMVS